MKTKYFLLFLALTALGLLFFYTKANVQNTLGANTPTKEAATIEIPSDFLTFYNKFHLDTSFQKAHITFPLKGIKATEETGGGEAYMYSKEEWVLHKPFDDMDGTFTRSFDAFGGIVAETIIANGGQFSAIRRFAKLGGEWNLIYYQPMGMY